MRNTIPLIGFLTGISTGIMWGVYAPYLRALGYSATLYGLISGSGVVVSAVSMLLAGLFADEVGGKKTLAIGLAVFIPSYILIFFGDLLSLVLASLLNGLAGGLYYTAYTVLVSKMERDDRLHHAFSFAFAYSTLGNALGLFMGWLPVLLERFGFFDLVFGYRSMFLLSSLFVGGSLIVSSSYSEGLVKRRKILGRKRILYMLKEYKRLPRALLILLLVNSIIGFGAAMSIHNIGYYFAAKYGVTSGELGSVLGIQQLIMGLMMFHLPRLVEKTGDLVTAYLIITSPSIPLLILMTLVNSYLYASIIYIVRSILMNLANPLFNSLSMTITPLELRGRASSILSLPWTLLGGFGRAVGGALMDLDLELPLRATGILYTIGLSILGLYFRKQKNRQINQYLTPKTPF